MSFCIEFEMYRSHFYFLRGRTASMAASKTNQLYEHTTAMLYIIIFDIELTLF